MSSSRLSARMGVVLGPLLAALHGQALGQTGWLGAYEQMSHHYTAGQPDWAGPIFTSSPLLRQTLREDFAHTVDSTGTSTWNLGNSRGLEFVPLPRLQFVATLPPYLKYSSGSGDGFGDITTGVKLKLVSAPRDRGNFAMAAQLYATVPTGSSKTGSGAPVFTPSFLAGKGWGRVTVFASLGGALPQDRISALGRTVTGNGVLQVHAARYLWASVETDNTAWFAGKHDGQVQSFLSPTLTLGRLPYGHARSDRQRGFTIGAGFQTAVTHFHTYNHGLTVTARLHF